MWKIASLITLLIVSAGVVSAREMLNDTTCHIEADTVIEGTLFVLCQELIIEGTVRGDVVGAVLDAQISGNIVGTIYLIGADVRLAGNIAGDVHVAALQLQVQTRAPTAQTVLAGNLVAATLSTTLASNAELEGSILYLGYQLALYGTVNGEINAWGSSLRISGTVNADIYATVGNPAADVTQLETLLLPLPIEIALNAPGLIITERGRVTGHVEYTGPVRGQVDGFVRGEIRYVPTDVVVLPNLEEPATIGIYLEQFAREALTLLVVGAVGLLMVPRWLARPMATLRFRPFTSFGIGLLTFILSFPVFLMLLVLSFAILLLLEVLGLRGATIGVGVMLALGNSITISVFYFVAIFIGRIVVALWLGHTLVRILWGQTLFTRRIMFVSMVVGVVLLSLLAASPGIGIGVNAIALFFGLGAIINGVLENFRDLRDAQPAPTAENPMPAEEIATQAPALPPPGMADLPSGFDITFFEEDD